MRLQSATWIIILFATIALLSCDKSDDPEIDPDNLLTGFWINPVGNDSIWTFSRAAQFKENDYGFSFKSDQNFMERKNAGWCGTPPVTYADFEGSWSQNDLLINITVDYWGGQANYQWEIVTLDENNLKIIKKFENYE